MGRTDRAAVEVPGSELEAATSIVDGLESVDNLIAERGELERSLGQAGVGSDRQATGGGGLRAMAGQPGGVGGPG